MSIPGSALTFLGAASGGDAGYKIDRSLRFNDDDSAYLNRTPSSAGNRKTFTFSSWIKRANLAGSMNFFSAAESAFSNPRSGFLFKTDGTLNIEFNPTGSTWYQLASDAVFRDVSAWYHVVVSVDTTQATASNRTKLYVNGVQQTLSGSYAPQNTDLSINNTYPHSIGRFQAGPQNYFDGYLAEVHFIDGQALSHTDFGELDSNNVWQPKQVSDVTYGTNGFHLDFSDNSSDAALGYDAAGSNNWTVNNLQASEGGTVYSASLSTNTTINSGSLQDPFDGDTSTDVYGSHGSGGYFLLDNVSVAYTSSLEVYYPSGRPSATVELNGSTVTVNTADAWNTIATGSGTLTSLKVSRGGDSWFFSAIRVDGTTILIDEDPVDCDSLLDTPTNYDASSGNNGGNYATWNPLASSASITLSNGNLDSKYTTSGWVAALGSIGVNSGKWYWEMTLGDATAHMYGVAYDQPALASSSSHNTTMYGYYNYDGSKWASGVQGASYGSSSTTGDVIGVALDLSAGGTSGTITFYKNGVSMGAAFSNLDCSKTYVPWVLENGNTAGSHANFGQRPFSISSVPTGFKSLCTQNLDDPTIENPSDYFDVDTYTGNNTTHERSEFSFSPDFVWIKRRNGTNWPQLFDTVRGATKRLYSNDAAAENTASGSLDSFDSDGFTLGSDGAVNNGSSTYVAWAWDADANSNKTYTVTVVSSAFRFDGYGSAAVTLDLEEGSTYVFDQSDSSNATHPLRFATQADAANNSEYTTGVTVTGTPGQAGAKTTIEVAAGAPTLYYYCSSHPGMGGQANTNGTAGASNFDGSIQSTVRANPSSGFSIVSYTGDGAASATIGHELNAAPELIIVKNRDVADDGSVYHVGTDATNPQNYFLKLFATSSNEQSARSDLGAMWNDTAPNSSVFSVGTEDNVNASTENYIAYCFAPVEGYSKFGSYAGNGSATDGVFVYTGFRPKFLIVKVYDQQDHWVLWDSVRGDANVNDLPLYPNLANTESANINRQVDLLSNGFKLRASDNSINGSHNYIYIAFAENPFKYARAR